MSRSILTCSALVALLGLLCVRGVAQPAGQTAIEQLGGTGAIDGLYTQIRANLVSVNKDLEKAAVDINNFIRIAPTDTRCGELLFRLGNAHADETKKAAAYRRVFTEYPESTFAQPARGGIRRIENVGKPFELTFTDLLSGKEVSVQRDFKGKVVVIEFWAGWCSDCIADMPRMKALHEQYKDKGVQFIGVSVDQPQDKGGLTVMKGAIDRFGINWPQYYQGNYMQSEFSAGWGVNATPWAFVIDKEGKLHSYNAHKQLETLIPELLK